MESTHAMRAKLRPLNFNGGSHESETTGSQEDSSLLAKEKNGLQAAQLHPQPSPSRKLSASRGVNLPEIRLAQNYGPISVDMRDVRQPPPISSPVEAYINFTKLRNSPSSPGTPGGDPLKRILNLCIFLPDEKGYRFAVEGGRRASSSDLISLLVAELPSVPFNLAEEAFSLWMLSPLLGVQLKQHHIPFQVRKFWPELLKKFTLATQLEIAEDEPLLMLRRNVMLTIEREIEICATSEEIERILYLDAKASIMAARCCCSLNDYLELSAVQMSLEWGKFSAVQMSLEWGKFSVEQHTERFIRESLPELVPYHVVDEVRSFTLLGWSVIGCRGLERDLLERYREATLVTPPPTARILRGRYLKLCRDIPSYGAAVFSGLIERPERARFLGVLRRASDDRRVRIAINRAFVSVFDEERAVSLLCVRVDDCSWMKALPPAAPLAKAEDAPPTAVDVDEEALPSLFLHFPDFSAPAGPAGGPHRSKLMQIFSKQAVMMEALLNAASERNGEEADVLKQDGVVEEDGFFAPLERSPLEFYATLGEYERVEELLLATYDASGECVDAAGSMRELCGFSGVAGRETA